MTGYLIFAEFCLFVCTVIAKNVLMVRQGIRPFVFAKTHKSDYLLPPFVLLFLYMLVAHVFGLPRLGGATFVDWPALGWLGVALAAAGYGMFLWGVVSFGTSFRVGIDAERPDALVTTGAFAVTRNPLYLGFFSVLGGIFLVFPHWFFLLFALLGVGVIHRQVLREEAFLQDHYGTAFADYCTRVRRYL